MRISDWSSDVCSSDLASELITLDADETPRFWVTIDTEEDFDWDAPFARTGYRLASVPALAECQGYFERAGVKPIYLVDWPIVTDDRAAEILGAAQRVGRCEIGAQLHPWVTRSEEHTSELQSLMRISYAVFCLKKKKKHTNK